MFDLIFFFSHIAKTKKPRYDEKISEPKIKEWGKIVGVCKDKIKKINDDEGNYYNCISTIAGYCPSGGGGEEGGDGESGDGETYI